MSKLPVRSTLQKLNMWMVACFPPELWTWDPQGDPRTCTLTVMPPVPSLVPVVRCCLSLLVSFSHKNPGFGGRNAFTAQLEGGSTQCQRWTAVSLACFSAHHNLGVGYMKTGAGRLLADCFSPSQRMSLMVSFLSPQYRATALPAFKYYVTCACLILFCIFIVQILVLPK